MKGETDKEMEKKRRSERGRINRNGHNRGGRESRQLDKSAQMKTKTSV